MTTRRSRTLLRISSPVLIVALAALMLPYAPAEAAVSSWQQKGISYYPYSSTDYASAGFHTTVDHYKSLGVNTITLVIPIYQSNTGSTDIAPGGNTPTDAALASGIEYAHAQGLKVMLKIHIDPYSGEWRANIYPSDRDTWYRNYLAQLLHYGQIAQNEHVEAYTLGTELIYMASAAINPDNTERWQNMIAQVRKVYTGLVSYDANWGSNTYTGEAPNIGFWSSVDFIGISAYYPLYGDASVQQDKSGWAGVESSEIGPLHDRTGKPVVFSEIGYRSVNGANQAPFDSGTNAPYNAQVQANAYEALFEFWDQYPWMQGADFWYANSNPNAGGAGDTDYLIYNKPVEQNVHTWFGSGNTGTTTPPPGPAATWSMSGSSNPAQPTVNQAVTSTVTVTDTGGAASGMNVDLETYDPSGQRLAQKIYANQNFSAGQGQSYTVGWTPAASGTYTVKTGIFDSAWNLAFWNDRVTTATVGTSGGGGGGTTTPPSGGTPATWTSSGSVTPGTVNVGSTAALSATVNDTGGAIAGTNIDLEVADPQGHQAFQKIYPSQNFSAGQSQTYTGSFTPAAGGTYTFKLGIFDSAWKLLSWNDAVATLVAGQPSGGGGGGTTTPPSSGTIDLWWPTNGATISGTQPFKVLLENASLGSYSMYWQVDGDQQNLMSDSQTDAPHKESLVDVSGWSWKGNGPYTLTFTAKGGNGATLGQISSSIYVAH